MNFKNICPSKSLTNAGIEYLFYRYCGEIYRICQVDEEYGRGKFCLISLLCGNRWRDPVDAETLAEQIKECGFIPVGEPYASPTKTKENETQKGCKPQSNSQVQELGFTETRGLSISTTEVHKL